MIAEDLKSKLDTLSPADRHEVATYLTKLELEKDPEYWKTLRSRTTDTSPERWISAEELD